MIGHHSRCDTILNPVFNTLEYLDHRLNTKVHTKIEPKSFMAYYVGYSSTSIQGLSILGFLAQQSDRELCLQRNLWKFFGVISLNFTICILSRCTPSYHSCYFVLIAISSGSNTATHDPFVFLLVFSHHGRLIHRLPHHPIPDHQWEIQYRCVSRHLV